MMAIDTEIEIERQACEGTATVEEIELSWWEPLGCKCDVESDD